MAADDDAHTVVFRLTEDQAVAPKKFIELTVKLISLSPHETEVYWSSVGTLFDGELNGLDSCTYHSFDNFAGAVCPMFTFERHVFPAELNTIRSRLTREPRTAKDRDVLADVSARLLLSRYHSECCYSYSYVTEHVGFGPKRDVLGPPNPRSAEGACPTASAALKHAPAACNPTSPHPAGPSATGATRCEGPLSAAQAQRLERQDAMAATPADPESPTVAHGLVGLALSGGGIRSSTFNLGIIQGLHRIGVLRHVDYLSTVSGGGYIGTAWSALTKDGEPFPFGGDKGTSAGADTPAVVHLRDHANYLVGGGWFDSVRMATAVLRGVFLNVLLMVPYLLLLATLTSVIAGDEMRDAVRVHRIFPHLTTFWLTRRLVVAYVVWLIASQPITVLFQGLRNSIDELGTWNLFRLLLSVAGLSDGTKWDAYSQRDRREKIVAVGMLLVVAVAFVEAQPLLISALHGSLSGGGRRDLWAGLGATGSAAAAGLSRLSVRAGTRIAMVFAAILGPALPLSLYFIFADSLIFDEHRWLPTSTLLAPDGVAQLACTAAALLLMVYARLFIDVNDHSGHGFWRDRLSKAFSVGHSTYSGELFHHDNLPFNELGPREGSAEGSAPYHLLNMTLNLQSDRRLANRSRWGDFFLFSKHFLGGPRTGFIPTTAMSYLHPSVNLGMATAISSAAAAPNMGSYTVASARFLMTLFNVRMGYWLPHPGRVTEALKLEPSSWPRDTASWARLTLDRAPWGWGLWSRFRATAVYLLYEMLGTIDDRHDLVYLSDGGHLENLGVYELLRRRCRYVIVGDGEADGIMRFDSLAALIRYARLDMGVEIRINMDDVRLRSGLPGRHHCAIGSIHYPARGGVEPEEGTLLYFKASMTGDEDSVIAQYQSMSPEFPHESTADQFFSEGQFEAYRSLGFHVATTLFEAADDVAIHGSGPAVALSYPEFEERLLKARGLLTRQPEAPVRGRRSWRRR